MKKFLDYFLILEVHVMASEEVIKAAYKRLCHKHHPDNGGNEKELIKIQKAYETLINESMRKEYTQKWITYTLNQPKIAVDMKQSLYDIAFNAVREVVLDYMFFIMSGEYESAYNLLSNYNKSHIRLNDYIQWQELVADIYKLNSYDCVIESVGNQVLSQEGRKYKYVAFKVKVEEMNMVFNRLEEDYFTRYVICEKDHWRIWLKNTDVRQIIKKYKKILLLNKKNTRKLRKDFLKGHHQSDRKIVAYHSFISNCEHEFLRYKRYGRRFTIFSVTLNEVEFDRYEAILIERTIEKNIRNIDSIYIGDNGIWYGLLPETNFGNSVKVIKKIVRALRHNNINIVKENLEVEVIECDETYKSAKELMKEVSFI